MDETQPPPFARRVAGFLEQLAPRGLQMIFARLELAGGQFDEFALERIAKLALEQHATVVE